MFERLSHLVDGGADLERGPQFDGHGGHEVVGLKQHQRLAVDLLKLKVLYVVRAAGEVLYKVAHLLHAPLQRIVLQDRGRVDERLAAGHGTAGLHQIRIDVELRALRGDFVAVFA